MGGYPKVEINLLNLKAQLKIKVSKINHNSELNNQFLLENLSNYLGDVIISSFKEVDNSKLVCEFMIYYFQNAQIRGWRKQSWFA